MKKLSRFMCWLIISIINLIALITSDGSWGILLYFQLLYYSFFYYVFYKKKEVGKK